MGLVVGVMSCLPVSVSRTESVAEKMLTNWFTFLLYKFLKVGGLRRREHQESTRDILMGVRKGGDQRRTFSARSS